MGHAMNNSRIDGMNHSIDGMADAEDRAVTPIPRFSVTATRLWATISPDSRKLILSSVWCGKCRHEVTMTNFSGTVRAGDLLLVGTCAECHGDVAKLFEIQ